MPVRISYDESLEDKVRFSASPGTEVCFALHCLAVPECHELQRPWIDTVRETLPDDLHNELVDFGLDSSDEWYAPTIFFEEGGFAPFEYELARAWQLPPKRLLEDRNLNLSLVQDPVQRQIDAFEAVRKDPSGWRNTACRLLERFWPYFLPTWERLQPIFASEVRSMELQRQRGQKIFEWLPLVVPYAAWNADQEELVLASRFDFRCAPGDLDSPSVRPSYFVVPHPSVDFTAHFAVCAWVTDALQEPAATEPADLAYRLGALASTPRLQIVRLLAGSPKSLAELSEELELSKPAVERHMRVLREAEIVRSVGQGQSGPYAQFEINMDVGINLSAQLAGLYRRERGSTESTTSS